MGVPSSEFRVPGCLRPATVEEATSAICDYAAAGRTLRLRGGGTKRGWGAAMWDALLPTFPRSGEENGLTAGVGGGEGEGEGGGESEALRAGDVGGVIELDTRGLDRVLEHNEGDFTAVLEAGVRLADAQAIFARARQMLALDPPLGAGDAATIGGIIATGDSGPLRHRYGGVRELVLGVTVVLSDGTVAKSGGKVIKNVAGYDLAKLFAGSYGTLGLIARVAVRLHPLATATATAVGGSADPDRLAATAHTLARLPLEADCLDVAWSHGAGRVLVRFSGAAAAERARATASRLEGLEAVETVTDDDELWARQQALQRGTMRSSPPVLIGDDERRAWERGGKGEGEGHGGTESGEGTSGGGRSANGVEPRDIVLKVSGRATDLAAVLRAADAAGGTVASRAALGLSWIALPAAAGVDAIRQALAPRPCTVLDGADRVAEPSPAIEPGALAVMKRVKERFDPAGAFQTGSFAGWI